MKLFNCVSKLEKQLKELELQGLSTEELVELATGIKNGFRNGTLEDETIVIDALSEIAEELGKRF